jgi:hypothetical protein
MEMLLVVDSILKKFLVVEVNDVNCYPNRYRSGDASNTLTDYGLSGK